MGTTVQAAAVTAPGGETAHRWTVRAGEQTMVVETTGDRVSIDTEWAAAARRRLCWVASLVDEYGERAETTGNDDLAMLVTELRDVVKGRFDGQVPAASVAEAALPGPVVANPQVVAYLIRALSSAALRAHLSVEPGLLLSTP